MKELTARGWASTTCSRPPSTRPIVRPPGSFRGPGLDAGLKILEGVRQKFGVPVLTDVHEDTPFAEVAAVVDVLQTPAFLCRQTNFIQAVGRSGQAGQYQEGPVPFTLGNAECEWTRRAPLATRTSWCASAASLSVTTTWFCRHAFPGSDARHRLPGDFRRHSFRAIAGRTGQVPSGGQREFVPVLARAAVAVGVAGVFMETHPDPGKGPFGRGPMHWPLARMESLLTPAVRAGPDREIKTL